MLATCSCPMWTACSGRCMHACAHAHGHAYLRVHVVVQDGDGVLHAGRRPSWSITMRLGCLLPRWTWLMRRADSGTLCMPRSRLMSVTRSACGLCGGCLCCAPPISWILACRSLSLPLALALPFSRPDPFLLSLTSARAPSFSALHLTDNVPLPPALRAPRTPRRLASRSRSQAACGTSSSYIPTALASSTS